MSKYYLCHVGFAELMWLYLNLTLGGRKRSISTAKVKANVSSLKAVN